MEQELLVMKNINKSFPGVHALRDVSLSLRRGEVHALIGENGAGKSTLMKVLSGVHQAESGEILWEGKPVQIHSTTEATAMGISIIYQELNLMPNMSIRENIFLGRENRKARFFVDFQKTSELAKTYTDMVGLTADVNTLVKDLSIAQRQMVEVAKALSTNAKLIVMDEPTSSLTDRETEILMNVIRNLRDQGVTVVFISHRLSELFEISDRITVLRDGRTVADFEDASQVSEDTLIKHMVGRELSNRYPPRAHKPSEGVFFEVKDWCVHHPEFPEKLVIKHADIQLRRGEVVGLAGLMGAGRTEFAMSVFGKSYGCSITGEVYKGGRKIDVSTVPKAIENGIAYLSEDRKTYGLILTETISKNISMANLKRISKAGVLNLNKEIKETGENAKQFGVKCASIFQNAGNLSGGNQQKVVLAKWMFNLPDVLILDEPTRGIDVGAKYDIYCIINELAASGKCVLVISSELPELLGVCDRIYVMNEGEIKGEKLVQDATQENIMRLLI